MGVDACPARFMQDAENTQIRYGTPGTGLAGAQAAAPGRRGPIRAAMRRAPAALGDTP